MKWIYCAFFVCFYSFKCSAMSESEIEDFENFLRETSQLDQNLKSKDPEAEFDEDDLVSDNAWEESGKFEGDLILNDRQRRMILANVVEGLARNGLTDSTKRWPNNEVIYFIQREHFNLDQVQAIEDGIADLARASCVKFTPYKKGDRDAVVIQGSRRGCFSQVGYQGGYQVLNLSGRHPVGRGCFRHGTIVHELLHSLGFYHMQSSPDRDDYIDVLWENIIQTTRHNFRKYNSFAVSDFGVGYDYESVLHYSRKAFSVNGRDTLVPKQRGVEIGQRVGLSEKDTQKLNKMYCDADSDLLLDSDTATVPLNKKKIDKNKPFEGRGIGYHQGKAVVIQLPAARTFLLQALTNIDKFNDFSKAKDSVSPMSIPGFGVVEEINNSKGINQYPINSVATLAYRGEQDAEHFPNMMNQEMDLTDARKLDYGQVRNVDQNSYDLPDLIRHSELANQLYDFKNIDDFRKSVYAKTFPSKSYHESKIYPNSETDAITTMPFQNNLLQRMKHKLNDNRYYTNQENIEINQAYHPGTENIKVRYSYEPHSNPNDQYYKISSYINGALDNNVSMKPNTYIYDPKESSSNLPLSWRNHENSREHYGQYNKEMYLDSR